MQATKDVLGGAAGRRRQGLLREAKCSADEGREANAGIIERSGTKIVSREARRSTLSPRTTKQRELDIARTDSYDSDGSITSVDSMESIRSEMDVFEAAVPRLLSRAESGDAHAAATKASAQQQLRGHVTGAEALRMRTSMRELLALCKLPVTLTIGDRRGRVRDAAADQGCLAISVDELESESDRAGLHVRLDARVLGELPPVERLFTFMPCEQQAVSLGPRMAAIKALDAVECFGASFNGSGRGASGRVAPTESSLIPTS